MNENVINLNVTLTGPASLRPTKKRRNRRPKNPLKATHKMTYELVTGREKSGRCHHLVRRLVRL